MQIRPFLFLIIPGVLLLFSCDKDEVRDRDYPAVRTQAVNNITPEGARFNATIVSGDIESITEYGFVWDNTNNNLNLQYAEKIMVNGNPDQESFSCEVTFALEAMEEYYVRPYVKSGDFTVYGEVVKFMSLGSQAPEITDFEPKSATWGDTITIYGRNFGNQAGSNAVIFDEIDARVIENSNELIKVLVPFSLNELQSNISVEIAGNRSTSIEKFVLITPVKVYAVSPVLATWLDTLKIAGEFPEEIAYTAKIDGINAQVAYRGNNEIGVIIPITLLNYSELKVAIIFHGHIFYTETSFRLQSPSIEGNYELKGSPDDLITLQGIFNPILANNKVTFSAGQNAEITICNRNTLQFKVPPITTGLQPTVSITSGNVVILNAEPFNYDLPVITGISPDQGNQGTILSITGTNFVPGNTLAYLGGYQLTITQISTTEIKAAIPSAVPGGLHEIKLKVFSQFINSGFHFEFKKPRIIDFSPKEVTYNDIVTIQIENFDPVIWVALSGGWYPEIISQTATELKIRIPNVVTQSENTINLWTNGYNVTSEEKLILKRPVVQYYSELSGWRTSNLVIEATGISTDPSSLNVYIGNSWAEVTNITPTGFEIKIPAIPQGIYPITLTIADYQYTISPSYHLFDVWSDYAERPLVDFANSFTGSFIIGNKIYLTTGSINYYPTKACGYFDFANKIWGNIADFPGPARIWATSWAIDNMGYTGFGSNVSVNESYSDVYTYDPVSNSWSAIENAFPGAARHASISFVINGRAYTGGGTTQSGNQLLDFYEFNPDGDVWTRKADIPESYMSVLSSCVINGKAYVQTQQRLFVYDPQQDTWEIRTIPGPMPGEMEIIFAIDHFIYFMERMNYPLARVWRYDVNIQAWLQVSSCIFGHVQGGIGFSYQNKGYYGLGHWGDDIRKIYEYDPLLEP